VLVLPPSLLPRLRRLREEQQLLFAALGKEWSASDYVFTSTTGTPVEPRNFNRYFAELVRRAELPKGTTPHRLRHANITAMITSQVDPRTAQERAGHSDVRVTLGVYTHSNLDLQRAAAAAIDARFALPEPPAVP
jgi:integrase